MYYNNLKITRQRGTLRAMNNYYPFGLMWDNPEGMPNATYQGKEFQTNTFSDGSELALYDFGARMYDPVLGRWHCADPMYQFDSPYNAMANNPVVNIDPDGMWSIPWGNIMNSIGGYIAAIKETATQLVGYADFVNGDTQPVYSSSASNPLSNLGQSLQVVGTLLQAWQDGKMIKDAAGEMGRDVQIRIGVNTYNAPVVTNFTDPISNNKMTVADIESERQVIDSFSKPSSDPTRGYLKAGDEYTKIVWDPNYVKNGQKGNYRQYWGYKDSQAWASDSPVNLTYNDAGGISQESLNEIQSWVIYLQGSLQLYNPPFSDQQKSDAIVITDGSSFPGANVESARWEGDQVEKFLRIQNPNLSVGRNSSSLIFLNLGTNQGQVSITVWRTFYVFPF